MSATSKPKTSKSTVSTVLPEIPIEVVREAQLEYLAAKPFRDPLGRTPEEILADRQRIFANSPPPAPLPEGKTFHDMLFGQWPGDETDEEFEALLRAIS